MSKYIQELMSPQLMMAVYLFIGFIVALYVLSVVYVFIDAKRRGVKAFWAWGLVALIREHQLAQYGACPKCGTTIEKDFIVCPVCNTQVRNVCPSCHKPLDAHWKVCPYCRTHIQ